MSKRGYLHCPRCGSGSVRWASGLPQLWSVYECRECGYRGPLVVKEGKLSQKIRKNWMRRKAKRSGKAKNNPKVS